MEIGGRKINITYMRKKIIGKIEKFMRTTSVEAFDNMDREIIIENCQKPNEIQSSGLNLKINYLRNWLKFLTRHLMCWHDGSTIGGHRYIVITISVMFDIAAFFSDEEYFLKYGENVCVQSIVEKLPLYIIAT